MVVFLAPVIVVSRALNSEDRGSIPGLATWIFRDWLSPASKSRYGWKIDKSTLILKTTKSNQPLNSERNAPPICIYRCQKF